MTKFKEKLIKMIKLRNLTKETIRDIIKKQKS